MIPLYAEFDTEEEAELWRAAMYRAYHPLGYSTHIEISKHEIGSQGRVGLTKWVAFGSRAESCD